MAAGSARGQTQTSSLGAARPLPPSADIGPAVRWSSCAILISGAWLVMEGYLPAMPGPVHAFFVARRYRTPGQSKGRSASRAGRPI